VMLPVDGKAYAVEIILDETVPEGASLIARSVGVPVYQPVMAEISAPVSDHSSRAR
jgi:hypothetical protein